MGGESVRTFKAIWVLLVLLIASCGDGAGAGGDAATVESPCELADATMVEQAFGGTSSSGVEGPGRDCQFEISGGPVAKVQVFEFGPAAQFEGVRSGYEDNRGGTFDVAGIGEEAFYPGDVGPLTLVVKASGQVFSVSASDAFAEEPPGTEDMVADLARAIATRLGS